MSRRSRLTPGRWYPRRNDLAGYGATGIGQVGAPGKSLPRSVAWHTTRLTESPARERDDSRGVCRCRFLQRSWHRCSAGLVWCLNVLAYCEDHHLDADFRFSFPASPGTDFFSPFFSVSPIRRSNARRRFVRAVRLDAVPHEVVSLERGSELARKYLVPQPEIVAELDQFWSEQRLDAIPFN